MGHQKTTKTQLMSELADYRERVAELEASEADWKRAEEKLRQSEELFRTVVQTAHSLVVITDEKGNNVYVSPNCVDMTGYTQEELQHTMKWWVHGDDTVSAREVFDSAFREGTGGRNFEYRAVKKSGEVWYASSSWAPLKDSEGRFRGVVFQVVDITERKKAEHALRESEERYRGLVELAPDPIVAMDMKGIITSVNTAGLILTGCAKEELVGRHFSETPVLQASDTPKYLKLFSSILKGEPFRPFDVLYHTRDGRVGWVEARAGLLEKGGKTVGVQAILRDITERKKSERALLDANEKWNSLTENSDDIIMIVDTKGVIQQINRTIPPHSPRETLGKTVYEYVPRDQHGALRESLNKVFKTGKPGSYEASSNSPKIGTLWFNTKVVPMKRDGKVVEAILMATDITDRKRAENEIKKFKTISDRGYGSAISDVQGNLLYVNESFARMHGYAAKELLGKNLSILHSKEQMGNVRRLIKRVRQKGGYVTEEVWHRRKDNTVFPTLMNGTLIRDDEGEASFMVATAVDITDRKKAEEALRESEKRLWEQNILLQEKNIALREVMGQVTSEKERIEGQIRTNVDQLLAPLLARLRSKSPGLGRKYIDLLEVNLKQLTSPFGNQISHRMFGLSQKQVEICNMIKGGLTSKEIAKLVCISPRTVGTYRNHIRKKLGITNKRISLSSYLKTL